MAALVLLTAYSCQSDDASGGSNAKPVDIVATIGQSTRVAYNGNAAQFTDGDRITLFRLAEGDTLDLDLNSDIEQTTFSLANGKWSASPQMLWYDEEAKYDFYAIYPSLSAGDNLRRMSLKSDIDSNDVMFAMYKGKSFADGAVPLAFSHGMAKLVVNLSKLGTEVTNTDNLVVSVKNALSHFWTNLSQLTIIAYGTASDIQLSKQTGSQIYNLLLPPQDGVTTITISDGTRLYTWTNSTPISLIGGKVTTVTLNVGEDYMLIGSVAVTDWTSDTLEGSEVEEVEPQ